MEHEEACFRPWGTLIQNIYNNFFELIGRDIEMWSLFKTNDMCYSDDELIEEYGQFHNLWWANQRVRFGFEMEWDPKRNFEHMKESEFKKEMKQYKNTHHPALEKLAKLGGRYISKLVNQNN